MLNTLFQAHCRAALCAFLAMLLLGGCSTLWTEPVYSRRAEVLEKKGEPSRRWERADGGSVFEYATQPYGDSCLMVEIDADGTVLRQWDALAPNNLARVRQGMSKDEVERLLGAQRSVQFFKLSGEEVWDWNIRNSGPGIATLFNVHFIDDKVVRSSQTYLFPRDGSLGYHPWHGRAWFGYGHPFYPRHQAGFLFAPHPLFWW